MWDTDFISWIFPVVFGLLIWYFVVRRLGKNGKGFKNQFREGAPTRLQHDLAIESFISKDDFTKANKQLIRNFQSSKWFKIGLGIVGVSFLLNFPFFGDFHHWSTTAGTAFFPFIIIVPVVLFLIPYLLKKQSEKVYENTEYIKHPVKYVFNSTGYEYKTDVHSANGAWETIQGYSVTTDYLVVYTSTAQGLFLAKSAFSPTDLTAFMHFLEANFQFRKRVV